MAPCVTLLIKNSDCFSGYYLMELKFLWLKFAILDISMQLPMVGHVLKQRKWINCVIKEIKCCLAKAGWRLGSVCSLVNCFLLNKRERQISCNIQVDQRVARVTCFRNTYPGEWELDISIVHRWISNSSLAGMSFSFLVIGHTVHAFLLQKIRKLESFLFGSFSNESPLVWYISNKGRVKCSLKGKSAAEDQTCRLKKTYWKGGVISCDFFLFLSLSCDI